MARDGHPNALGKPSMFRNRVRQATCIVTWACMHGSLIHVDKVWSTEHINVLLPCKVSFHVCWELLLFPTFQTKSPKNLGA